MIGKIINEIKNEFNYQIDNFNYNQIEKFINLINGSTSNIHLCGVGKSNNTAKHFCDLLKCISIKAFHFSVIDSTHDVCDLTIELPFRSELSGEINQIPTNSFMSNLLFSNIVVSILKNNLTLNEYKANHPSGNIGNNLLKVEDVLIKKDYPIIELKNEEYIDLHEPLLEMTKYKFGCCCFVDSNKNLIGILTDGDIRRMFLNQKFKLLHKDLNSSFHFETDLNKNLLDIKKLSIKYIPFTSSGKLIGILNI